MNDVAGADGFAPRLDLEPTVDRRPVTYDGRAGELARITITNSLLTLVTLGVYRFWGKTRLRRYLWGHVSFLDDRLEYSGRGMELFLGFLIALLILSPLVAATLWVQINYDPANEIRQAVEGLQGLIILFLIHVALYRARRYRLTRTRWRGIRAGQDGSAFAYALRAIGWAILVGLTLGLAYAVYRTRLQHYRTTHTRFGERHLDFHGRAGDLFGPWLITWGLSVVTLGAGFFLAYPWYRVREFRYFAWKTRFGGLAFASDLSAASVYRVFAVYFLSFIVVAILLAMFWFLIPALTGIAGGFADLASGSEELGPMASTGVMAGFLVLLVAIMIVFNLFQVVFFVHPLARVVCNSVSVSGDEDFEAILQSQQAEPSRGEGLADALDVSPF